MTSAPPMADAPFHCPAEKRAANFIDLAGQQFGRLAVKSFAGRRRSPGGQTYSTWHCVCDCGSELTVSTGSLRSRQTISCGCERTRRTIVRNTRHGQANKVPEYSVWKGMKSRCYNSKDKDFCYYGARGIVLCDAWKADFMAFLANMGRRPSAKHTIERKDVNGNYEPANCIWLEAHLQSANRRSTGGNFR